VYADTTEGDEEGYFLVVVEARVKRDQARHRLMDARMAIVFILSVDGEIDAEEVLSCCPS
jgi:hypothetical protein